MKPLSHALENIDSSNADAFTIAKAKHLMIAYNRQYNEAFKQAGYKVLGVEQEFFMPVINPSGGQSNKFIAAGKLDVLLYDPSIKKSVVLEHKTTDSDIGPSSPYWLVLNFDSQVNKYSLAALNHTGELPGYTIYDVMRKPGLLPLGKRKVLDEDGKPIVWDIGGGQRSWIGKPDTGRWRLSEDKDKGFVFLTEEENPDQYGQRIYNELIENPDKYFAQKRVYLSGQDYVDYGKDQWDIGQEMAFAEMSGAYPRNPKACNLYNRSCQFLGLCSRTKPQSDYVAKPAPHRELSVQPQEGAHYLTKSAEETWLLCKRKYQLSYLERLELAGEHNESLFFGTLMHNAWEAYYKAIKNQQNGG